MEEKALENSLDLDEHQYYLLKDKIDELVGDSEQDVKINFISCTDAQKSDPKISCSFYGKGYNENIYSTIKGLAQVEYSQKYELNREILHATLLDMSCSGKFVKFQFAHTKDFLESLEQDQKKITI